MKEIPSSFVEWCYRGRAELVNRMASGEKIAREELMLGFTRHCPTVITVGPAGLNGSVKGVGFVPKPEFMDSVLDAYLAHIDAGYSSDFPREGLSVLSRTVYSAESEEKIDFTKLATIELAKAHTWANMQVDKRVTLVFFEPPQRSFEIRAWAEIHEDGLYHTFVNAQHDVYHKPSKNDWGARPVYVFDIMEIYDNSAAKDGFGKLLYRK